jgi:uncharacterized protein (DUF305 family)
MNEKDKLSRNRVSTEDYVKMYRYWLSKQRPGMEDDISWWEWMCRHHQQAMEIIVSDLGRLRQKEGTKARKKQKSDE